jgi:hypothetical protein
MYRMKTIRVKINHLRTSSSITVPSMRPQQKSVGAKLSHLTATLTKTTNSNNCIINEIRHNLLLHPWLSEQLYVRNNTALLYMSSKLVGRVIKGTDMITRDK